MKNKLDASTATMQDDKGSLAADPHKACSILALTGSP